MSKKVILKHLWESILIGFVSSMIVTAFFMPYYDIHHRVKNHVNEVLTAFNPIEEIVSEIQLEDSKTRLILFDDITNTTGTIFSPTLLFSKVRNQEETMFYSSFDFFYEKQLCCRRTN
jgi:glucan phosphoethanolaminetransferase (alkaline phosphatase superfamily)